MMTRATRNFSPTSTMWRRIIDQKPRHRLIGVSFLLAHGHVVIVADTPITEMWKPKLWPTSPSRPGSLCLPPRPLDTRRVSVRARRSPGSSARACQLDALIADFNEKLKGHRRGLLSVSHAPTCRDASRGRQDERRGAAAEFGNLK